MSHPTVYLISGANRGIGLALVEALAQRDNVRVFAGARNPDTAADLQSVTKKYPGKVDVVKLVSADKENNESAIKEVEKKAGRLDVVVANAGIAQAYEPAAEAKAENLLEHFNINAVGSLILFQTAWPLLKQSTSTPKFVPITSTAGSIGAGTAFPVNFLSYGTSKAALNYITRKLYSENETLIAFPVCPGPVETDMAIGGLNSKESGMKDAFEGLSFYSTSKAAAGLLKEIDSATRESHNNVFATLHPMVPDGKAPW